MTRSCGSGRRRFSVLVAAVPVAATIQSDQANVFTGTYLSGSTTSFAYGTSSGQLPTQWDNVISSVRSILVTGHGIIFYTGPDYTDLSWTICGPATWNTLPQYLDNAITSYRSTSSCPQRTWLSPTRSAQWPGDVSP